MYICIAFNPFRCQTVTDQVRSAPLSEIQHGTVISQDICSAHPHSAAVVAVMFMFIA